MATEEQHQDSVPFKSWGPVLPACCLHSPIVTRLSSPRPCSARDPASGLGARLCCLPLLLLAPLDVPVGLDDASSLLRHDALPSHGHGHCRGCRALAQAGSQEEPLPSRLRAEMGQSAGMGGGKGRTRLWGADAPRLSQSWLSRSDVQHKRGGDPGPAQHCGHPRGRRQHPPDLTCSAGPWPLGRDVMVGGCVTTSPNATVSKREAGASIRPGTPCTRC